MSSELRETLAASLVRHKVTGASVAVYRHGRIATAAGGVTNVNTGVPITEDTVMHIGSIAKVFTATLVMQLVERGEVELDAPVRRYLPQLQLRDAAALNRLTVRMLLNHTSGIDGELLPEHDHDDETVEKAIVRFAALDQLFQPGSDFSYCNAATVIAGYLAQRVTGVSWYRLIRERILVPLGMHPSAVVPEETLLYRAAVGHYLKPGSEAAPVRTSVAYLPLSFAPSGTTLMMSARALLELAIAHLNDGVGQNGARILQERSARIMRESTVDNRGKRYVYTDGTGLGWMVHSDGLLHHSGGGPGLFSVLYVHPQKEFAAAVLTNAEHGLTLINDFMAPWLDEISALPPLGMAAVPPAAFSDFDPTQYVGVYEDIANRYQVRRDGAGLVISKQARLAYYENISLDETPPVPLREIGPHTFVAHSELADHDDQFAAFRIFEFRNADASGLMQHVGNCMRLYRRVSG